MNRRRTWDSLKTIVANINQLWLMTGDFIDIAFGREKKGGAQASARRCQMFRENMDECNLVDIGASGPKFTWRGPIFHGGRGIYERLDRACGNKD